jgi:hypothetical protein
LLCQIHSADELVLTELVLENVLADYTPEEIVALLSAFVFQEKTDTESTLTASLERGVAAIVKISEKVNEIQTLHQVILSADDSNDFVSKPRFGMVEVVYEWARGMSFNRITDLTDVMEGTIVRIITRLDETCREVKNAARIIGDPVLFQKMGTCQELIKRYVQTTSYACMTGYASSIFDWQCWLRHYWDHADFHRPGISATAQVYIFKAEDVSNMMRRWFVSANERNVLQIGRTERQDER